jgi:hypothetical protein
VIYKYIDIDIDICTVKIIECKENRQLKQCVEWAWLSQSCSNALDIVKLHSGTLNHGITMQRGTKKRCICLASSINKKLNLCRTSYICFCSSKCVRNCSFKVPGHLTNCGRR